jgi:hypothetical protein
MKSCAGSRVLIRVQHALTDHFLKGAMQVDWRQMLVLCAFILTLGVVLRYAGVRCVEPATNAPD